MAVQRGFIDDSMKIRKIVAITVLVLSSFAASNVAPSKAELEAMYDKAFREFDANNFSEALKQLDSIDALQTDLRICSQTICRSCKAMPLSLSSTRFS